MAPAQGCCVPKSEGRSTRNPQRYQRLTVAQVEYAVQLMQPLALGCIKASFIMFYRRIFCTGQRNWFSIYTIVMLVLILIWSIAFCFVFIFRCGNDFSASWGTVEDLIVYCPTAFASQEAFAISDFIMDVMVILAPVPLVWVDDILS